MQLRLLTGVLERNVHVPMVVLLSVSARRFQSGGEHLTVVALILAREYSQSVNCKLCRTNGQVTLVIISYNLYFSETATSKLWLW